MAQNHGQLQEFIPKTENITAYLERVELYFVANGVKADKQVAVFLSVVGGKIYSLLRDLLAPKKPQDTSLAGLQSTLTDHFDPKPLVIAERFVFHQRSQQPNESAAVYVAELRRLATNCTFGDFLDEALRDRFVCGLRTVAMQKRLLTEAGLTLKKAVELAQGMEAADTSAKKLQGGEIHGTETPIHRAETRERGRTEESCYRCGGIDHTASNCRFRETVCNRCRKRGHIARACRGGGLNRRQGQRTNQPNAQVRGGPFF